MTRALAFLLLLVAGPAWAQPADGARPFDAGLAASVVGAALALIVPRALDPVTMQQLALWGLAAPASLDARFDTEFCCGAITLLQDRKPLLTRPIPTDADPAAWGALVADILAAAAAASPDFAAGGTQGALSAFFDEMFNHLDPYSRYVPPEAAGKDRERRVGVAGAGIQIARRGPAIIVTGMNADGTGADAGIQLGDAILAVDGRPTAGIDAATVDSWIVGEDGTPLTLLVRTRGARPRLLDLERAVTPPETVFASRLPGLLLIRITAFSRDTDERLAHELDRAFAGPAARTIRAVVIDLRGNRGGRVANAVGATDLLLDRGVVTTTAGRDPEAAHVWRAGNGDLTGGRPVLVLVDGRTASAAEIMAAALVDQRRAVAIGSATLGKGLVQKIDTLPGGGELFISWSRILAPDGWPLQGLGVLPQVCTSLGQDALTAQLQSLDHGTQPLAPALARHNAARAPLPTAQALALRAPCPASEPRDTDLAAARFLATHPTAYATALLPPTPRDP